MLKKKMYILTNGFPYGKGEKTFILPEVEKLSSIYELTIIAFGTNDDFDSNTKTELKENIKIVKINKQEKVGFLFRFFILIKIFFSECFLIELIEIIKKKNGLIKDLKQSLSFQIRSWYMKKQMISFLPNLKHEKCIVYSYWNTCYTLAAIYLKKMNANMKVVTRTHRYDLYNDACINKRQSCKKYVDKYIDRVLFISEYAKKYYLSNFSYRNDDYKYCVIYLGTNTNKLNKAVNSGTFHLLSCSNIVGVKRIDRIIDALYLIDDIKIDWKHIGSGNDEEKIKNYAKRKLNSKKNIEYSFLGYMEPLKVEKFYQENDIVCFINVSKSEGLPVSIMEALSCGIPIIMPNLESMQEIYNDNGVLLSREANPSEIKAAIEKIYNLSKSDYIKMKEKSIDLFRKRFDNTRNVEKLIECIGKL